MPYLVNDESRSTETLCTTLHDRWIRQKRVGAIVGPHGAGKSTLVAALQQAWAFEHGYQVVKLTLHNGQRTLPSGFWSQEFREQQLVIVDGYEQLGWFARWRLNRLRRRTGCGLLVTTHAECRLPTLHCVEPSLETLLVVERHLLASWHDSAYTEGFIARHALRAWQETGANARETLFRLYDCWEQEIGGLRNSADDSGQRDASDSATLVVSSN
jgi:energy-coupling factor transporter ATP-binding protein EcfA2